MGARGYGFAGTSEDVVFGRDGLDMFQCSNNDVKMSTLVSYQ